MEILERPSVVTYITNYNGFITTHKATMYGSTPYGDYLRMIQEFDKIETAEFAIRYKHTPPTKSKKKMLAMKQLEFNTQFVIDQKERCGSLTCVFCGQPNLVIYPWNAPNKKLYNMATCDHFHPKSEGGASFDVDNCVVACHRCNQNKRSKKGKIRDLRYLSFYGDFKTLARKLVY